MHGVREILKKVIIIRNFHFKLVYFINNLIKIKTILIIFKYLRRNKSTLTEI